MRRLLLSIIAATTLGQAWPAHSQPTRVFPQNTKVGMLVMGYFPEAQIDGKDVRFSPGARILSEQNAVVIPATLTSAVRVRYRIDEMGQVSLAWILTEDEIAAARRR